MYFKILVLVCFALIHFTPNKPSCQVSSKSKAGEVPEELREMGEVLHGHCVGETSVNEQLIENAKKGDFSDDRSFKCYLRCLFEETSMITDDGKFDAEAMLGVLPPSIQPLVGPSVTSCAAETPVNEDQCETMWMTIKCFYNKDPVNDIAFYTTSQEKNCTSNVCLEYE